MNRETILRKVIYKVRENGLDCELSGSGKAIKIFRGKEEAEKILSIGEFIFLHSFAKAFWGENELVFDEKGDIKGKKMGWEYHLTKLALAKDRLKYLSKFL